MEIWGALKWMSVVLGVFSGADLLLKFFAGRLQDLSEPRLQRITRHGVSPIMHEFTRIIKHS